jgi:hypothetical protein
MLAKDLRKKREKKKEKAQKRIELAVRPGNQPYMHAETGSVYPSGSLYNLTVGPRRNASCQALALTDLIYFRWMVDKTMAGLLCCGHIVKLDNVQFIVRWSPAEAGTCLPPSCSPARCECYLFVLSCLVFIISSRAFTLERARPCAPLSGRRSAVPA